MGCDIHIIAEVKINNNWKVNTDKVFPNPYYEENSEYEWEKDKTQATPDGSRRYDWFAILADVRNGSGFAGIKTGDGFNIISEPRGVPRDATDRWKAIVHDWSDDMHSHSYLDIKDFDGFDWNQTTTKQGIITLEQYKKVMDANCTPEGGWSGDIFGAGIRIVDIDEAKLLIEFPERIKPEEKIHVRYRWSILYKDWFEDKIKNVVEPLRALTQKYGEARILFGFNN